MRNRLRFQPSRLATNAPFSQNHSAARTTPQHDFFAGYPAPARIAELNWASALLEPERVKLKDGVLELVLPVNGLALVEISSK